MMKHFLLCTALLSTLHCASTPNKHVNNGIAPTQQTIQSYPPDISFCIVDLKYNKPRLKICEFGEGVVSGFYGYQRLYGQGKIWTAFWEYLEKFKRPIFYVDPQHNTYAAGIERSLSRLRVLGGNMYKTVPELKESDKFLRALQNEQSPILVSCRQHKFFKDYKAVTQAYPNAILLDNATRPFVLNKFMTHLLFMNDPEIEHYRPGCKIIPSQYTTTMASEIINEIPAERYVIKPMNAFHGKGIIFVEQKDLDQALKSILCPSVFAEATTRQVTHNPAIKYWQHNPKPYLLVESYETSQPVCNGNKSYDATMRVAFGISYDPDSIHPSSPGTHRERDISITFFGAYWKLPKKAINEPGSLSERYQSHIQMGTNCSAKVDSKTLNEVEKILRKLLPKVYIKMIAARHDPEIIPGLMAEINGVSYGENTGKNT